MTSPPKTTKLPKTWAGRPVVLSLREKLEIIWNDREVRNPSRITCWSRTYGRPTLFGLRCE